MSAHHIKVSVSAVVDDQLLVKRLLAQEEVPGLSHQGGHVGGHGAGQVLHTCLHHLQGL